MAREPLTAWDSPSSEDRCAYINGDARPCGASVYRRSSYCREHHEKCHANGRARIEKIEAWDRLAEREARWAASWGPQPL